MKETSGRLFMRQNRQSIVLFAACFIIGLAPACPSGALAQADQKLTIDVPVKLEKANVVFDVGKLVLNGEMPFFIGDMDLLATDLKDWNVTGQIIAVFHGDAAYLVLNDDAYDANRHIQTGHPVKTGNPYAKLLAGLMEQGVQIELCGATAAANHWGNADLLPGVKVNTNARSCRDLCWNLLTGLRATSGYPIMRRGQ
jgi:intracellular sulfur oxidation DsrE/DsrF family protein